MGSTTSLGATGIWDQTRVRGHGRAAGAILDWKTQQWSSRDISPRGSLPDTRPSLKIANAGEKLRRSAEPWAVEALPSQDD